MANRRNHLKRHSGLSIGYAQFAQGPAFDGSNSHLAFWDKYKSVGTNFDKSAWPE